MSLVTAATSREFSIGSELIETPWVQDYLLRCELNDLYSVDFEKSTSGLPFFMQTITPGPTPQVLGGRDSMILVCGRSGPVVRLHWVEWEGNVLRHGPMVTQYCPETNSFFGWFSSRLPDGNVGFKGCALLGDSGFTEHHGATFVTDPNGNVLVGCEYTTHYYDCDFCIMRGEACDCPTSLRYRSVIDLKRPVGSPPGPYDDAVRFLWHMRRPATLVVSAGHRLRLFSEVGPKISPAVVQRILVSMGAKNLGRRVGPTLPRLVPRDHHNDSGGSAVSNDSTVPTRQEKRTHQCTACGKSFLHPSKLRRHVEAKHERAKNHSCPACGSKFSQKAHLDARMRHLHEKARKLNCTVCSEEFLWQSSLNRHIMRKHKTPATSSGPAIRS